MIRIAQSVLALLLLSDAAYADDRPVYESLRDIRVGRVFFTREQRQLLDEQRRLDPAAAGQDTSPGAAAATPGQDGKNHAPAGYIIVGSGQPKKWSDGDFVPVDGQSSVPSMIFPGDVAIIRHRSRDVESLEAAEEDAREVAPEAGADGR